MANTQMQKDAGLMDYIDSAAHQGGRLLRDLYKDVVSPAGRSLETVVSKDVIDPAISKIKEVAGPRWNDIRRAGRSAKNYVLKGLTGLDRLGSDVYNTARGLYNSSGAIEQDLSRAYGGIRRDFGNFAAKYKANSGNTLTAVRSLINRHLNESSNNMGEFGSNVKGTLDDLLKSITSRASGGMQKSSALQKEALNIPGVSRLASWLFRRSNRYRRGGPRQNLGTLPAGDARPVTPPIDKRRIAGLFPPSLEEITKATNNTLSRGGRGRVGAGGGGRGRVRAGGGGRGRGRYGSLNNRGVVNNINIGNNSAVPAAAATGASQAATQVAGRPASNVAGNVMNGLGLGMMGYSMLGGGGGAAAGASQAAAQVAANPAMYAPQANYVNWAANNNVLKGLYM